MRGFRELYGNSILDILEVYKGSVKITIVDFVIFLTLNELALLIRCLVMLKTIIMGERQEPVMGILNCTSIVQC